MKTTLGPAALSAVLSLALLGLAGCGDDQPAAVLDPAPTTTSTTPADEPTAEPTAEAITFDDGTRAVLTPHGEAATLAVTTGGSTYTAPIAADSDSAYLVDVQLELGQAGSGWVLGHEGGDSTRLQVFVIRRDALVAAEPTGTVDLGSGFTADGGYSRTWFDTDKALTRVSTKQDGRFRLYGWEVTGSGEGGGAEDAPPLLQSIDRGIACITGSDDAPVVRDC